VLLDLNLPDTTGLKLLGEIRAERDDVEIIIITSHAEIKNAVSCVKAGAFDFLAKSFENYQQIAQHVERALEHRRRRRKEILDRADETLREALVTLEKTTSPELLDGVKVLRQIATTTLTVLIEGESGVGKEILARYVHLSSDRRDQPFVPVNMAAIPSALIESALFGHEKGAFTSADRQRLGKFELADGGTLFLDEVGELEPQAQAKLLRALQEKEIERIGAAEPSPVDVRVVAATNKDLEAEVRAGRFREDLWYRLNVVRVRVPPLRARKKDIPPLIELLAARHARLMGREAPVFATDATDALAKYAWPGNVRELENLIMRMVALHPGQLVRLEDLPVEYCVEHLGTVAMWNAKRDAASAQKLYALACDHFERYFVKHMVDRCAGNMAEAARRLGVSYATVKNKMHDAPKGGSDGPPDDEESA
jgi:DNA-binding NtrC family response regulator